MKLSFQNVKGRSGSYDLPSVTVVHGDNFSGKSAILTALRLGLIGYDPTLGKTNAATWQLSSGRDMRVTIGSQAGGISRTWELVKGSVKLTTSPAPSWHMPEALVDVRQFLAMPAKARAEYILGLVPVPAEAVTPDALIGCVPKEHRSDDVQEFITFWDCERIEHGTPTGDWLAQLCETAAVRARDEAGKVKESEAALRQFTAEVPGLGVQDCSADITAMAGELESLLQKDAAMRAAGAQWQDHDRRRLALQSQQTELDAQRAALAVTEIPKADEAEVVKLANELGESLRAQRQDLARLQTQRTKLGKSGKCPTCGCEAVTLGTKLDKEIAKVAAKVATLEPDLSRAESVAARVTASIAIRERIKTLEEWIASAQLDTVPAYDKDAHAKIGKELSDLRYKLNVTQGNQRRWNDAQARRKMQAQAETQATAARAEAETWGAVAKALKGLRDDVVAKCFRGFCSKIEQFTDGILPFDLDVKDGELGYMAGGVWVSHEVMSGSEVALVYAGLGVALAESATVKVVMMDEVLISTENKRRIADRMRELAKAGTIDAFVVVDVTDAGWPTWCEFINTNENENA